MEYLVELYIDPGTGGMLFSVLFGLFGVALFSLRALLMRVKYRSSVDKNSRLYDQKIPIVIFNEHKRYWNIFEPIMDELDKVVEANRDFDVEKFAGQLTEISDALKAVDLVKAEN